ncbi:MAG: methionyl-tRNA formyltransferase [bacterium]
MRVVFAGTPAFSLSSLEALVSHSAVDIAGVFTQPDRPAGRGRKLVASPIKQRAVEIGLDVFQPESFKVAGSVSALESLKPDLVVVTAYGLILPQEVLDIPRLGCVNVHASLLPRWRGAAPIQRAIEAGDLVTGVTLMLMQTGLDTGPILASVEVPIEAEDTGGSLHDKLAVAGGRLLSACLGAIREQRLEAIPQQDEKATYAHKLTKAEAMIDWNFSAQSISRKIRALNPWPIATTRLGAEGLRLFDAIEVGQRISQTSHCVPGEIVELSTEGIIVATAQGHLCIRVLQKAGGKTMDANSFVNGTKVKPGMRFG